MPRLAPVISATRFATTRLPLSTNRHAAGTELGPDPFGSYTSEPRRTRQSERRASLQVLRLEEPPVTDYDPMLAVIMWEYKDRGKVGYDVTEQFFDWFENRFPSPEWKAVGKRRGGRDIELSTVIPDYP